MASWSSDECVADIVLGWGRLSGGVWQLAALSVPLEQRRRVMGRSTIWDGDSICCSCIGQAFSLGMLLVQLEVLCAYFRAGHITRCSHWFPGIPVPIGKAHGVWGPGATSHIFGKVPFQVALGQRYCQSCVVVFFPSSHF